MQWFSLNVSANWLRNAYVYTALFYSLIPKVCEEENDRLGAFVLIKMCQFTVENTFLCSVF